MKKFFALVMMTFAVFAFTACDSVNSDKLIGKWSLQNIDVIEVYDGETETSQIEEQGLYIEFKSDGTYVENEVGGPTESTGKWKLDGGKVVILDQGTEDERSFIIKEVTSSKLDLEFHLEEKGEEYVLIYVYHFTKEK